MRIDLGFKVRQLGFQLFLLGLFPPVIDLQQKGEKDHGKEKYQVMAYPEQEPAAAGSGPMTGFGACWLRTVTLKWQNDLWQKSNDEITNQYDENEIQVFFLKIQFGDKEVKDQVKEKQDKDVMQISPDSPVIAEEFADPSFSWPEYDRQQQKDGATDNMEEDLSRFAFHHDKP